MNHILNLDKKGLQNLYELFHSIKSGNTILFLGAGASVTNKTYLSKQLIDLYEAKISKKLDTDDIIEFVDILQSQSGFNRNQFDNFVEQQLRRLEHSDAHLQLVDIPWHQIITTNYDVLLEQAAEKQQDSGLSGLQLKVIRSKDESYYTADGSQMKYIKLNGCISDKSKYPLVFSSKDFEASKSYYKQILNNLKGLSDRVNFVSIGYSYQDKLANQILKKFDSYNYRQRRVMYNVDPFVNEHRLEYYSEQNICVIRLSMEDFFTHYKAWDEKEGQLIAKSKKINFSDSHDNLVKISGQLSLKVDEVLRQLSNRSRFPHVKDVEFYLGEEPNFDTIRRGVDVKRTKEIQKMVSKIKKASNSEDFLVPMVFSKGRFGTGKTTIAYQVIDSLLKDEEFDGVAFEVVDYLKISANILSELFKVTKSKNVILYFNAIEIDSHFRMLTELRYELSAMQISDCQIIFYASIRENILEKHKKSRQLAESIEVKVKGQFEENELEELVDKLSERDLIQLRDKQSKNRLVKSVSKNFGGDSFLTLANLLTNGRHREILLEAYDQLSEKTKEAFIYTSLTYRFKIPMPSSILLPIVSSNWQDFRKDVIEVDGKGILNQRINESRNAPFDLVFVTKHSALSEILIQELLKKTDQQYKHYHRLISVIESNKVNSIFVIDVLKALSKNSILEKSQINHLSDLGYNKFSDEPHYLLYYAMNLQRRRSLNDLKKGIQILYQGEALLERRNHRFVHRRAVINFDLAKLYYQKEKTELDVTMKYLEEADDLFKIKQSVDPFSSYSYLDFIRFKIWSLEKIEYNDEDELKFKVHIQELFDFALRAVRDNQNRILSLKNDYLEKYSYTGVNYKKYEKELISYYDNDIDSRPYALVLLAQFYVDRNNAAKLDDCIEELGEYTHVQEVSKFLFKYYGRRLYDPEKRASFFELLRNNEFLEKDEVLRYHFYCYVAQSYDTNFNSSFRHLDKIRHGFGFINPDYNEVWKDSEGYDLIFDAKVVNYKGTLAVRVSYFPRTFFLDRKSKKEKIKVNDKVTVQLNFYLFGIKAEIVIEE